MNRFRYLWYGQALSTLGDILYILALVTTLYRQSGSAAVAALFPLLRVSGITVGGFGAPLVLGRFRVSTMLAFCLLVQAAGLCGLAMYSQGWAGRPHVTGLTAAVFLLSVMEGVAGPARSSLVPRVVERAQLLRANGTLAAVTQTCSLAAWAFGAILVSRFGAGTSLWVSTILLLLAGGFAVLLRLSSQVEAGAAVQDPAGGRGKSVVYGWKCFLRLPPLRLVLWLDFWDTLLSAAFAGALLLVFAEQQLNAGETWWGWMNGGYCAGLILANWSLSRYVRNAERRLAVLLLTGSAGMAICVFGFAITVRPETALAVMFIIGAAESAKQLAATTLLQLSTPPEAMPSVFAAQSTLIAALFGVSLLLAGWLADRYGIRTIYFGAAACYTMSFLGAAWNRSAVREVSN